MNSLPADASSNQDNCPEGYYRRSNGMVMQLPAGQPPQSPITPVDINDSQALKELATSALVQIIQNNAKNVSLVGACRELLDRAVGKPLQTQVIEQNNTTTINYTATDRFLESLGIKVIEHE